jgi:hypothetical protein
VVEIEKIGKFLGLDPLALMVKNYYCRDCMRVLNRRYKNTLRGKIKTTKM